MADEVAIEKHAAIPEHAVELKRQAAALVRFRQGKSPAIPADVIRMEARPNRLETMAGVRAGIKGQFNGPIVRQIDFAPGSISEVPRCRPGAHARLVQPFRQSPLITQMKPPAKIHQHAFSRRLVCVCRPCHRRQPKRNRCQRPRHNPGERFFHYKKEVNTRLLPHKLKPSQVPKKQRF